MPGTTIFFSYAHQDEPLVEELKKHLTPFKRQGLIAEWHDHNILPGTPLNSERECQLSHATLIVLCVTSDFLNSDYCYSVEMRPRNHHRFNRPAQHLSKTRQTRTG